MPSTSVLATVGGVVATYVFATPRRLGGLLDPPAPLTGEVDETLLERHRQGESGVLGVGVEEVGEVLRAEFGPGVLTVAQPEG